MFQPAATINRIEEFQEEEQEGAGSQFGIGVELVRSPSVPNLVPSASAVFGRDFIAKDNDEASSKEVKGDDSNELLDEVDMSTKTKSKLAASLFFPNKKIACVIAAAAVIVGFAAFIGASIGGSSALQQLQEQKNVQAVTTTSVTSCGQTFTGEVVLTGNLTCTDNLSDATNEELEALNAAIKLEGPGASIDCQNFVVSQGSNDVVNCKKGPGASLGPSYKRKDLKLTCNVYYQMGIWLKDGATAINCKSEYFYQGYFIQDGGEIQSSEAAHHFRAVDVREESESGSVSKISNMHAHDNYDGIFVWDLARKDNVVVIEDSTSENNQGNGITLRDSDITVKDSISRNNGFNGIRIAAELIDTPTTVTFEGDVSLHNNRAGIDLSVGGGGGPVYYADVIVKGVLNTYSNTKAGLDAIYATSDFTVKECGLFISCDNAVEDILIGNEGLINFVEEGTDGYAYDIASTCGSGSGLPPTRVACDDVSTISPCELGASESPSSEPSKSPSSEPSSMPSKSNEPSSQLVVGPPDAPSSMPSTEPSGAPSSEPSSTPSDMPSSQLVVGPPDAPSSMPSSQPSDAPSSEPSSTSTPSDMPSSTPSTIGIGPTPTPSAHSSKSSKGRTSKSSKTAGTTIEADFMTSDGHSLLSPRVINNIALTLFMTMTSGFLAWFMF